MAGQASGSSRRLQERHIARDGRVYSKPAGCRWVFLCLLAAALGTNASSQPRDSRDKRAGDVAGLEDGRISLARVSSMLTSSVHTELAGSEDAFRRLLDHEWDRFSASPAGTRGSFLVCSAPGRANAKRLRELAGAPSLVETLHRRKGEAVCSFASLDAEAVALVAAEGRHDEGEAGGAYGTFSLEPLPHLAKLSPTVAADPSPAALLLSSEAAAAATPWAAAGARVKGEGNSRNTEEGGRRLRGGDSGRNEDEPSKNKELPSAEERARVLAEAAAAGADRPTTRRLIREGESGMVDAVEILLVNHHERRSKGETEELTRRWLSLVGDRSALTSALRTQHFWGKELPVRFLDGGEENEEDSIAEGGPDRRRRRHLSPEEAEEEEEGRVGEEGDRPFDAAEQQQGGAATKGSEEERRAQELRAHEERKRLGWAGLLDVVHGRGSAPDRAGAGGEETETAAEADGLCRFDKARFTVSPSGKKVLLHRPHEMAAAGGGDDDGCLSALMAYVSLQPEVRYVTARRKSVTMNLDAAWVTQSAVDGITTLWDANLQGQDQVIGVADTGVDMNHCHFREDDGDNIEASDWDDPFTDQTKRKVVQYIQFVDDFDEEGGHGTHVAGSLAGAVSGADAGDGDNDGADGIAYQGKLAVFDFGASDAFNALSTPDEVDTVILDPAYTSAGARIHSNSWDTVSTEYTSLSQEMDEYVYTHPDLLVLVAAGNCGDTTTDDLTDSCSILDDDEGTVLSPAQGKNVVAVGASESGGVSGKDENTVSYFSSQGPTIDGRIKPDIVAPGDPTWSAYADPTGETCGFGLQTGTSMSTPVAAGNAAMARQYYKEGWYNDGSPDEAYEFDPSAALLKATLINSATAMLSAGVNPESSSLDITLTSPPDNYQGFGRLTMINALNINSTVGLYIEDWKEIREGETLRFNVSIDEDADLDKDLSVTLVWMDPPASVGSTSALIHDLDLVVIANSTGTEYYPNGLDGPDTVNNVEKVVISGTTELEVYWIDVSCNDLSENDFQTFAFVANGEFIKTSARPEAQDPDDWSDLLSSAASELFTWRFGAILALAVIGCCAVMCACRSCNRSQRHRSKVNKYRSEISANRGAPGRKLRPNAVRPQPFEGPMRASARSGRGQPGALNVTGPGRYQESWRRPGPGSVASIGGRSMRSMRSEQSARGVLLTAAGAVVPGQVLEETTPASPPYEACPECGLRLPDAVQLVKHVETQHGGRATRRAASAVEVAPNSRDTAGLKVVRAKPVAGGGGGVGRNGAPVVSVATSKDAPPRRSSNPYADARAAAAASIDSSRRSSGSGNPYADARAAAVASANAEAKRSPSKSRSKSPVPGGRDSRGREAAVRHASAVGRAVAATAAGATAASRARGRVRSKSPGASRTSSSSGSSAKPRSGSPAVSGDSPGVSGSSRSGGGSGPTVSRTSLPRIKDLSGHGNGGNGSTSIPGVNSGSSSSERQESKSPLPRIFSHRRVGDRGSRGAGASSSLPVDDGGGRSGGGGRRERGRGGQREAAPGFEQESGRRLVKEGSTRSLTRTSSLDRMSALSSRAFTRPTGEAPPDYDFEDSGGGSGGPAEKAARVEVISQRRIRRTASTEDIVLDRLTADRLRALGSGLEKSFDVPAPVFSPVKKAAKEPAYSPVDRERAGELDEQRPASLTRKFFRQLSGEFGR